MPRIFTIMLAALMLCGCNAYQPTKNVWKGTKSLWATYVSPPANVDYEDKGALSPQADLLVRSMVGVDNELARLERVMQNADKPPTMEWMERLFANFPWLSGFAGVKYDGTILGQQPENSLKELDFNYLLHEDAKQKSRALRADVQPSPVGPEVMLAAPLYDGVDFLGIVVAYFDMRTLMGFSNSPQDIVVLTPTALLWPGKYDFAATPLPGVDWSKVVRESSQGTCSNATGTFFYLVRYLANLPLVFAVPQSGNFPEGNGSIEQGFAFYGNQREKGTPPPVSEERLKKEELAKAEQAQKAADEAAAAEAMQAAQASQSAQASARGTQSPNDLQPGSRDSVLLRKQRQTARRVEERQLAGENVQVERVQRPRRRPVPIEIPDEVLMPPEEMAQPAAQRPSPFGPGAAPEEQPARPSPFGPPQTNQHENIAQPSGNTEPAQQSPAAQEATAGETPAPASSPESARQPEVLPGGRPSPFGPRN